MSDLLDADAAIELMIKTKDAAVFADRGWGNSPLEISIISGGDGQNPLAFISQETMAELKQRKVLKPNSLQTFKARSLYEFRGIEDIEVPE
jgi:hypothetical protein